MPIRPENRARYGDDWPEFSARIRFTRANGRCECVGECGMPGHVDAEGRCENRHGDLSVYTGSKVILTVAHLNHVPEERGEDQVKAMCQGCHLWYDRDHHAATRRASIAGVSQLELDLVEIDEDALYGYAHAPRLLATLRNQETP